MKWLIIILVIVGVLLVGGIGIYFLGGFRGLSSSDIDKIEVQSKDISYDEYHNLASTDMTIFLKGASNSPYYDFYQNYYLYPGDYDRTIADVLDDVSLNYLNDKGIDIEDQRRICFVTLYGSISPDNSKYVFSLDLASPNDLPIAICNSRYNSLYDFFIFDKNTVEIKQLPKGSIPIIWIDNSKLLYEKTTSEFSFDDSRNGIFLSNVRTNIYLYNLDNDAHIKLSDYGFAYHRKDIQQFAVSSDKTRLFFQNFLFPGYEFILINSDGSGTKIINLKECKNILKGGGGESECGEYTWSKKGDSILYSHKDEYGGEESFRLIKLN